jgi:serine/threonine protein kinase
MAPEVIQVHKDKTSGYGPQADVWSLGITAIEIADGKPPLFDIAALRVIFLIPSREPPTLKDPSNWSDEFNDFISQCLQKDPTKRPTPKELYNVIYSNI